METTKNAKGAERVVLGSGNTPYLLPKIFRQIPRLKPKKTAWEISRAAQHWNINRPITP